MTITRLRIPLVLRGSSIYSGAKKKNQSGMNGTERVKEPQGRGKVGRLITGNEPEKSKSKEEQEKMKRRRRRRRMKRINAREEQKGFDNCTSTRPSQVCSLYTVEKLTWQGANTNLIGVSIKSLRNLLYLIKIFFSIIRKKY